MDLETIARTQARSVRARVKRSTRPKRTTDAYAEAGSALTVVLPVIAGREASLRKLLTEIGTNIRDNAYIKFSSLESAHFMRWVLIPPASTSEPTQLAFESNHDGSAEEHLDELLAKASRGMHAIYSHCVGYPVTREALHAADAESVRRFLLGHRLPYCAFYVGVPGAKMKQVRGEEQIRRRILAYLTERRGDGRGTPSDALALAQGALELIRADAALSEVLDRADDSVPFRPLRLAGFAAGALAAAPALVPALLAIRVKELFDEETTQVSIPDEARALMAREDLQVQNQLTHLVALKPGLLRAASLRIVLFVIDFLAHELFTRGRLGGISSIHFARWVLIDEGKRLLFFSNYDGSWESYLGDFIDKASTGLTSVWSNTQGFPKSKFLLFRGATDEERFKAWTRAHQLPTQLWYSAYPDLTVRNIQNNRRICTELRRGFRHERAARRWLSRFGNA